MTTELAAEMASSSEIGEGGGRGLLAGMCALGELFLLRAERLGAIFTVRRINMLARRLDSYDRTYLLSERPHRAGGGRRMRALSFTDGGYVILR